jgi:hypothetical protein
LDTVTQFLDAYRPVALVGLLFFPLHEGFFVCAMARGQVLCRFSDADSDEPSTHSGGRRLKSAKARNRGTGRPQVGRLLKVDLRVRSGKGSKPAARAPATTGQGRPHRRSATRTGGPALIHDVGGDRGRLEQPPDQFGPLMETPRLVRTCGRKVALDPFQHPRQRDGEREEGSV